MPPPQTRQIPEIADGVNRARPWILPRRARLWVHRSLTEANCRNINSNPALR